MGPQRRSPASTMVGEHSSTARSPSPNIFAIFEGFLVSAKFKFDSKQSPKKKIDGSDPWGTGSSYYSGTIVLRFWAKSKQSAWYFKCNCDRVCWPKLKRGKRQASAGAYKMLASSMCDKPLELGTDLLFRRTSMMHRTLFNVYKCNTKKSLGQTLPTQLHCMNTSSVSWAARKQNRSQLSHRADSLIYTQRKSISGDQKFQNVGFSDAQPPVG